MDANAWFHWLFPSPGYFLLALAGLLVLVGLIAGVTNSSDFRDAGNQPADAGQERSKMRWWMRDEAHYRQWHAEQVRDQHRPKE